MALLDCSKKCSLNQFWIFFVILAFRGDIILLTFIAGSNRKGLQTKKCWFAFLVLIIETPTNRPANEVDSNWTFSSINFLINQLSHQSTFSSINLLINQLSHL